MILCSLQKGVDMDLIMSGSKLEFIYKLILLIVGKSNLSS
jgi:hypothetical protein